MAAAIAIGGAVVGVASGQPSSEPASNPTTLLVTAPTGSVYVPLTPNRVLDTRANLGIVGRLHSKVAGSFQVTDLHSGNATVNVPPEAVGVTGNLTVTGQTSAGYLSLTLTPINNPTTSTLNFPNGDTRANAFTGALGSDGKLAVTFVAGPSATTDAVFDVTGYFVPGDGSAGPPGADGVSGREVVTGDFVMTLQVEYGTSTVDCPAGKVPVAGGYDYSDLFTKGVAPKYENFIGASYPTATGWAVKWYHGIDNLAINFSVYAICALAS